MKRLTLYLMPAVLMAGQARYARLGDFDGKVEIQLHAADAWMAAQRNLPLPEATWLRTAAASKVEIELDEGSAWRMGPDSQAEISDYTRLSTGQRVTLLSLDRGIAYFTGEPAGKDALSLAVPGAQVVLLRGARVRLEALESWSRVSVIEGMVKFSSPAAEMDLAEGQSVRIQGPTAAQFSLETNVVALPLDGWSEQRDQALESSPSSARVPERYGLKDLDSGGQWIQSATLGTVWKPDVPQGWQPFQKGRWLWYDALGYTWVSDDPWGWLPYHYGRWSHSDADWVWVPGAKTIFKPGEVYWFRGAGFAGWGPLAPDENWTAAGTPQLYSAAVTSFAAFQQDARVLDPAGLLARPQNPLANGTFRMALPSPEFPASRLEAVRPALRVGSTRVVPSIPGVSFEDTLAPPPPEPPPTPVTDPNADASASVPPPDPTMGPPPGVGYPPGAYPGMPGIIVVTPPGNPDYARRYPLPNRQSSPTPPPVASGGGGGSGPAVAPPAPSRPRVKPDEVPRVEPRPPVTREARNEPKPPANPPASASRPSPPPAPAPTPRAPEARVTPPSVPKVEPSKPAEIKAEAPAVKNDSAKK